MTGPVSFLGWLLVDIPVAYQEYRQKQGLSVRLCMDRHQPGTSASSYSFGLTRRLAGLSSMGPYCCSWCWTIWASVVARRLAA